MAKNVVRDTGRMTYTILAIKLKMINQDRMIFGDFSVNFEPIAEAIFY